MQATAEVGKGYRTWQRKARPTQRVIQQDDYWEYMSINQSSRPRNRPHTASAADLKLQFRGQRDMVQRVLLHDLDSALELFIEAVILQEETAKPTPKRLFNNKNPSQTVERQH